jgi:hypothetical protein
MTREDPGMTMIGRDGTDPDSPFDNPFDDASLDALPDSGMASGTDAGQPGGHLGPGDLAPDEERLLAALERDARTSPGPTVEESLPMVRAAEDEAPLPAQGGIPDDGLTPLFAAPEFEED